MPDVEINAVAGLGLIEDRPSYLLPPEAWSTALNVRYSAGSVLRLTGREQIFGTPTGAPWWILSVLNAAQTWWLYGNATDAWVYNGSSHTEITRASGDYNATAIPEWNTTILGGIPIINNGTDDPQFWASYATGTKLADLTNWPASTTCKVMRAYGNYLVALNITESGTNYAHRVKWSAPADPGSVPGSWDETDASVDAGENELDDVNSGLIRDGLQLGHHFYIYKDEATWLMRSVGGRFIFSFDPFLTTSGILAARSVVNSGDGKWQIVVTQDDIIAHNGQEVKTIVDRKVRQAFFNDLSVAGYANTFLFANSPAQEVWICYPSSGQTNPDQALIINYGEPNWPISRAEVDFNCATIGTVETSDTRLWSAASETWGSTLSRWAESNRRKVVVGSSANTKIYQLDSGQDNDGTGFTATLGRTGLAVAGKDRTDQPIVDWNLEKMFHRVWPKMEGGPVNIRLGTQNTPEGAVTWTDSQSFDPTTDEYLDFTATGRGIAIEISTTDSVEWKWNGVQYQLEVLGEF